MAMITSPVGTWTVQGYDPSGDGLVGPLPGSRLTVTLLGDGRLEGETACDTYIGGYTFDDEALQIGIAARGPARCGRRRAEEASGLIAALTAARWWRAAAGDLELVDEASRVRVVLVTLEPGTLAGDWVVRRHQGGGGGLRPTPDDATPTLMFSDDQLVSGSTGCRAFSGSYSTEGDRLLIAPLDIVGLPCEGRAGRREEQFLGALYAVVTWQRDGDTLTLLDAAGDPLVEAELLTPSSASPPTSPGPSAPDAPGSSVPS
jgi:heat shock protein HslJ